MQAGVNFCLVADRKDVHLTRHFCLMHILSYDKIAVKYIKIKGKKNYLIFPISSMPELKNFSTELAVINSFLTSLD